MIRHLLRIALAVAFVALLAPAARAQLVPFSAFSGFNCTDTAGQHLNWNNSTYVFSCGTSVPANVVTTSNIPSVPTTTPLTGTGSAGGVQAATGSLVLPNGTSATTQSASDNSTKVATTAYVDGKTQPHVCTANVTTGGTSTTSAATYTCTLSWPVTTTNFSMLTLTSGGSSVYTANVYDGVTSVCSHTTSAGEGKTTTSCSGTLTAGDTVTIAITSPSGTDGSNPAAVTLKATY